MMLDEAQAEHSGRVREHLRDQIAAAGGWLSFERFMELVLYAPGLGYYSGGAQKLGKGGDFTTAPEISGLFGRCVAVQCAEVLKALHAPSILEIGAGSGRLAADMLARLEGLGQLPENYWILEVSADLRQRQRALLEERLAHLLPLVVWLDRPPEEPFDGIVLANEVLDALPVARFRWTASDVDELGVGTDEQKFAWVARPASPAMAQVCRRLSEAGGGWDAGYVSEYCPRILAWTRAATRSLRTGAALWFDYGLPRAEYYLPERHDGTLVCHYRHCVSGDQNRFARLAHQARQLMLPGEMGERFKAMAWLRGLDMPLSGFQLLDLRHTL
jgi:SAM-dependent MidA family methyltransferase